VYIYTFILYFWIFFSDEMYEWFCFILYFITHKTKKCFQINTKPLLSGNYSKRQTKVNNIWSSSPSLVTYVISGSRAGSVGLFWGCVLGRPMWFHPLCSTSTLLLAGRFHSCSGSVVFHWVRKRFAFQWLADSIAISSLASAFSSIPAVGRRVCRERSGRQPRGHEIDPHAGSGSARFLQNGV